ncbi:internalin, partial [Methanosarcina sp. DH2]|nr:internalin [Methanosarcina sp. DH2]
MPIQQNASYTIDKIVTDVAGNGPTGNVTKAGDVISYQINVTNTGNVDLTNVSVTDPLIGNLIGPAESLNNDNILEVGETWTYTGTYTVTQQDINSNGNGDGDIDNTATVDSEELPPQEDSEEVPIQQNASYTIDKIVTDVAGNGPTGNVTKAGDVISYQINVTNTGNVDLTNVSVTDTLIGNLTGPTGDNEPLNILNVGETWTYTGTYTVTQQDINSNGNGDGDIDNTATVDSEELPPQEDSEEVPIQQNASYTIDKIVTDVAGNGPTGNVTKAGDVISYQINVTNTGNVD